MVPKLGSCPCRRRAARCRQRRAGAEYRPAEFLGLDLSKAVLSKTPLGPPTELRPSR